MNLTAQAFQQGGLRSNQLGSPCYMSSWELPYIKWTNITLHDAVSVTVGAGDQGEKGWLMIQRTV
jgi:hypothetical protein